MRTRHRAVPWGHGPGLSLTENDPAWKPVYEVLSVPFTVLPPAPERLLRAQEYGEDHRGHVVCR